MRDPGNEVGSVESGSIPGHAYFSSPRVRKSTSQIPALFYVKPSNKVLVFQNIGDKIFMSVNSSIRAILRFNYGKKKAMILVTKLSILSVFSWSPCTDMHILIN